jgi:hypothetical protein
MNRHLSRFRIQVVRFIVIDRCNLPTHLFELTTIEVFGLTGFQCLFQFIFGILRGSHSVAITITIDLIGSGRVMRRVDRPSECDSGAKYLEC